MNISDRGRLLRGLGILPWALFALSALLSVLGIYGNQEVCELSFWTMALGLVFGFISVPMTGMSLTSDSFSREQLLELGILSAFGLSWLIRRASSAQVPGALDLALLALGTIGLLGLFQVRRRRNENSSTRVSLSHLRTQFSR